MKKLILMTSALTLIGGAAVAEITVSAEASLSYGNWDTANGAHAFGYGTSVTFAGEETTASGITYGGSLTVETGEDTAQGVLYISTGALKFSFGIDEFDATESEALEEASGDIELVYSAGAITATLVAEAGIGEEEGDAVGPPVVAADVDMASWDFALDYDGGTWTVGITTDSDDYSDLTVTADVGSFTVGGTVDSADAWDVFVGGSFGAVNAKLTYDSASVTGVELDGAAGDVTWSVATNTADSTQAALGYSMGAISIDLAYDSDNAGGFGDDAETILTVGYAAGDNLDFGLLYNDGGEYEISVTAGFTF